VIQLQNSEEHQAMDKATHIENEADSDVGMIRDFIEHVRNIVPMLEHVKDSIEESSGRIPKASKQLSEVTTATESATVEILNVLEAMGTRFGDGEAELKIVREFVQQKNGTAESQGALKSISSLEQMLSEAKENSMSIAIALQVQDSKRKLHEHRHRIAGPGYYQPADRRRQPHHRVDSTSTLQSP